MRCSVGGISDSLRNDGEFFITVQDLYMFGYIYHFNLSSTVNDNVVSVDPLPVVWVPSGAVSVLQFFL